MDTISSPTVTFGSCPCTPKSNRSNSVYHTHVQSFSQPNQNCLYDVSPDATNSVKAGLKSLRRSLSSSRLFGKGKNESNRGSTTKTCPARCRHENTDQSPSKVFVFDSRISSIRKCEKTRKSCQANSGNDRTSTPPSKNEPASKSFHSVSSRAKSPSHSLHHRRKSFSELFGALTSANQNISTLRSRISRQRTNLNITPSEQAPKSFGRVDESGRVISTYRGGESLITNQPFLSHGLPQTPHTQIGQGEGSYHERQRKNSLQNLRSEASSDVSCRAIRETSEQAERSKTPDSYLELLIESTFPESATSALVPPAAPFQLKENVSETTDIFGEVNENKIKKHSQKILCTEAQITGAVCEAQAYGNRSNFCLADIDPDFRANAARRDEKYRKVMTSIQLRVVDVPKADHEEDLSGEHSIESLDNAKRGESIQSSIKEVAARMSKNYHSYIDSTDPFEDGNTSEESMSSCDKVLSDLDVFKDDADTFFGRPQPEYEPLLGKEHRARANCEVGMSTMGSSVHSFESSSLEKILDDFRSGQTTQDRQSAPTDPFRLLHLPNSSHPKILNMDRSTSEGKESRSWNRVEVDVPLSSSDARERLIYSSCKEASLALYNEHSSGAYSDYFLWSPAESLLKVLPKSADRPDKSEWEKKGFKLKCFPKRRSHNDESSLTTDESVVSESLTSDVFSEVENISAGQKVQSESGLYTHVPLLNYTFAPGASYGRSSTALDSAVEIHRLCPLEGNLSDLNFDTKRNFWSDCRSSSSLEKAPAFLQKPNNCIADIGNYIKNTVAFSDEDKSSGSEFKKVVLATCSGYDLPEVTSGALSSSESSSSCSSSSAHADDEVSRDSRSITPARRIENRQRGSTSETRAILEHIEDIVYENGLGRALEEYDYRVCEDFKNLGSTILHEQDCSGTELSAGGENHHLCTICPNESSAVDSNSRTTNASEAFASKLSNVTRLIQTIENDTSEQLERPLEIPKMQGKVENYLQNSWKSNSDRFTVCAEGRKAVPSQEASTDVRKCQLGSPRKFRSLKTRTLITELDDFGNRKTEKAARNSLPSRIGTKQVPALVDMFQAHGIMPQSLRPEFSRRRSPGLFQHQAWGLPLTPGPRLTSCLEYGDSRGRTAIADHRLSPALAKPTRIPGPATSLAPASVCSDADTEESVAFGEILERVRRHCDAGRAKVMPHDAELYG